MTVILPRVVKVAVGPPGGLGREWSDLYITFDISKVAGSTPNKAKVQIYNLSPYSLKWLEQPGQILQISAGEGMAGQLFYGDLSKRSVKTKVEQPNQITSLEAADGRRIFRDAFFTGSYPAGTTRSQILTDVLTFAQLARGYVGPLPERVFTSAVAFCAPTREVLSELFAGELATWSIQDGAFQLITLGQPAPGNVPVICSSSGMIGSPERTDKGVKIVTKLDPSIRPGGGFMVQSRLVNGLHRVTKVRHKGNSNGSEWQTEAVGVPVK